MVDLFTTSLTYRLPVYFSPVADPMVALGECDDAVVGRAGGVCLPSFWVDRQGSGEIAGESQLSPHPGCTVVDPADLVSGTSGPPDRRSCEVAVQAGPAEAAPLPSPPRPCQHAEADCVSYIRHTARAFGLSDAVAQQLTLCR